MNDELGMMKQSLLFHHSAFIIHHSYSASGSLNRLCLGGLTTAGSASASTSVSASARCSIAVCRIRWLKTAASYQLKLSSGLLAKRPSVFSASDLCASSYRKM